MELECAVPGCGDQAERIYDGNSICWWCLEILNEIPDELLGRQPGIAYLMHTTSVAQTPWKDVSLSCRQIVGRMMLVYAWEHFGDDEITAMREFLAWYDDPVRPKYHPDSSLGRPI